MSKIEVNEIVKSSGSTLTIGGCGTAVTLGAGATQSGFGRSGSVDWQTTPKTSTFTAVSGEGYFINASGSITMNLPAGSAGAIVAVADYARNFATHNFIISPNGSEKIGGIAANATLDTNGAAATLIYVDSTKGWVNVQNADSTIQGATFVAATGGNTVATSGNFKIHTFTSPGTFTVTCAGNSGGSNSVDYLVVAGGASGGAANGGGGGGGAGGLRYADSTYCTPAPAPSAGTALSVTATAFPVTVGAGGAAITGGSPDCKRGNSGSDSVFSTITSAGGGGGGGGFCNSNGPGLSGGSGGGGGKGGPPGGSVGGSGNTPPVIPPQGNAGGTGGAPSNPAGNSNTGGGGGGAGAVGADAGPGRVGGDGGNGLVISINGSCTAYGGGGGGQSEGQPGPAQGSGGTGGGGDSAQTCQNASAGSANTGGGGGGVDSNPSKTSGAGGSGIVIIRYKFQ